ncbi:hypothetical protein MMC26_003655 [Xylographa opegraphella]|nr:hypothetical protein [Xylographa opegraphella]
MSSLKPTRRHGASTVQLPSTQAAQPPRPPPTRSPLLPTPREALLLAIYPSTLLLGSLFSLLNPLSRAAPYSAVLQSHPPAFAPSYFARKKNLFNVFFVKIGWFWTTLAFVVFLLLHPSTGPPRSVVLTPRRAQAFVRYMLVTAWWVLVTQWFFGPGLVDRSFLWTGGQCELVRTEEGRDGMSETRQFVTGAACKLAGGSWKGGHDISGHVFLLVLGSAFLWLEILPVVMRHAGFREQRLIVHEDGGVRSAEAEVRTAVAKEDRGEGEGEVEAETGVSVPVVVAGLSWWMLLMTAAYFHTWFEKVSAHPCRLGAWGLRGWGGKVVADADVRTVHRARGRFRGAFCRLLPSEGAADYEGFGGYAGGIGMAAI